jgi:ABC-type sugar transport system substrate-binding protein
MRSLPQWRRWSSFAALTASAALVLSACGGSDDEDGSGGSSNPADAKIGIVIKGLDNPFFQHMEDGINDQAKASGMSVKIQSAASITDTSGQADKLSAIAGSDYDCFLVNPISGTNLISGIAQIAAQGTPIVNIDNPIDAKAAEAANADIATYIGDVANVGGIAGDVTSGQRIDGFKAGLGDNFTVVQEVAANWDRQEAQTQAEAILQAHSDLAAFFVANDDMAMGVARAVADAGKTGKTLVVSVDGIDGVASGDIDAAVAQYPYVVGKMGLEACQAAAAGNTLPTNVKTPIALITPDNAKAAQDAFPEPPNDYADPFADLLAKN